MIGDVSTLSDPSKPVRPCTPAPDPPLCRRVPALRPLDPCAPSPPAPHRSVCPLTPCAAAAGVRAPPRRVLRQRRLRHSREQLPLVPRVRTLRTRPPTHPSPRSPPSARHRPPPSLTPRAVQVRHDGVRARSAGGRLRTHRLLSTGGQRAGRGDQLAHPEPHPHPAPHAQLSSPPQPLPRPAPLPRNHPPLQPHPHPCALPTLAPRQVAKFLVHNAREQAPGGDSIDNFFTQQKRVSGADDVRAPSA